MENLIRIKLDPNRGGENPFDFKRPCFVLYYWPSETVEIWSSDDSGQSWDKLAGTDFRVSYDPMTERLYVSLLFDITGEILLAFFDPGGNAVGIGFTVTSWNTFSLGWMIEGTSKSSIQSGCSIGSETETGISAGWFIFGGSLVNTPIGHNVKRPNMTNMPAGYVIAAPEDGDAAVGFAIGIFDLKAVIVGVTNMGLAEFGADFIPLDDSTEAALCAEAAWHKQKIVTLNGTTPEELD